jgi:hypothetical protein
MSAFFPCALYSSFVEKDTHADIEIIRAIDIRWLQIVHKALIIVVYIVLTMLFNTWQHFGIYSHKNFLKQF